MQPRSMSHFSAKSGSFLARVETLLMLWNTYFQPDASATQWPLPQQYFVPCFEARFISGLRAIRKPLMVYSNVR